MNKKTIKRIRQRNFNVFVEYPKPQTNEKSIFGSLRELIGIVTAGAGIFAALLYLAGRFFASGYFSAMNIPDYQVSFSLWEYGEVAWLPLILYPLVMMAYTGLFWGVFFTISDWLSPLFAGFWDWLQQKIKLKLPAIHLPPLSRKAQRWFIIAGIAASILSLLPIAISILLYVQDWGVKTGRANILENSAQVELISTIPMALDDNNLTAIQASGQNYYTYKGFHLLTYNNNKYYLFKEIDPVTCKPIKVYIINTQQGLQINLLPIESLSNQCQKAVNPIIIVTSTASPSNS